ncbi:(d)CMP kinase [Gammaproteobacteria bacterium]|jgi:cytidylate kinase|nr:(d)CMP kinase [Gammaproteobacteria bacterium]MDA9652916.1 (d)CMP kinase [Pseudomonadota bacterium]MDB2665344.1 (d)CMP kinase [Gammaproteobacteria bacterium]MDB9842339.1 (d)CMP kinase [Gammaproteobacteria bacterium]MDB9996282.1 (d)CMP kinase [Gammaproteobacteria bacterium]|tara:strand:+ start:947 stop:1615 length:669 start_codon:yes stop_codon:yes gene_type:complete
MTLKNKKIITIDGPSASGKGLLARKLAKELDFILLDSGLLYRAYSYCFDKEKNHDSAMNFFSQLTIEGVAGEMEVFEGNNNITQLLRHENVALSASKLSSLKETRENLIAFQRGLANDYGLIADGRDMGTVVFPDAATKIFLIADVEVRAERRFLELQNTGQGVNMRDLIEDIRLRDEADRAREISPLVPATDSVEVNSSNLTPQEVLNKVLQIYKEHIKEI